MVQRSVGSVGQKVAVSIYGQSDQEIHQIHLDLGCDMGTSGENR